MKAVFAVLVQLMVTAPISLAARDLSKQYRFSATLDAAGLYSLFWSFDEEAIIFAVEVQTTGWVGFGLSPNGQMPGSDVVIGWVDQEGEYYFHVS